MEGAVAGEVGVGGVVSGSLILGVWGALLGPCGPERFARESVRVLLHEAEWLQAERDRLAALVGERDGRQLAGELVSVGRPSPQFVERDAADPHGLRRPCLSDAFARAAGEVA